MEVTLYGATAATYERVTRTPGSYARCMHGIELLRERGIPLRLKAVVLKQNVHELWDMQRRVREDATRAGTIPTIAILRQARN